MPDGIQDLRNVLRTLAKHVLVTLGPTARSYWQFTGKGCDNHHMNAVCMFCLEFALHGSCEHTHAAFVETKQLSLQQAHLPQFGRRPPEPPWHIPPIDLIIPGPASSSSRPAVTRDNTHLLPGLPRGLRALLTRASCLEHLPVFAAEELTPADVARLDLLTARAIFPRVPAAALLRVLRCAQARLLQIQISMILLFQSNTLSLSVAGPPSW